MAQGVPRPAYRAGGGRRSIVALAGALVAVFIVNSLVGLFAIDYARKAEEAQRATETQLIAALDAAREAQVAFKIQVQEWKNLLLRGLDPADYERYMARFAEQEARVAAALASLRARAPGLGIDGGAIDSAIRDHALLGRRYREALGAFDPALPASVATVDRAVRGIDRPLDDAIDALADSAHDRARALQDELGAAADERYLGTRTVAIASMVLGLALVAMAIARAAGKRG
ncbi:hypothetical protein [Azospirillum thermophilum]|uniref:Methyl-accepting chemotaxis protein n=1 Tax=Azospirillum thermophilum TaxID=2202148 RepID=A0A2S2CQU9_9PROT|nr:hypothetical protein [Azospirillum thermophilum]AWK86829.1 hypothetical protein DEW08_11815 [Azospirillum thermophilum]